MLMDETSVTREAHHAAPRCLIALHEKANGTALDGEGIQAWLEWEWEAMRWRGAGGGSKGEVGGGGGAGAGGDLKGRAGGAGGSERRGAGAGEAPPDPRAGLEEVGFQGR